MTVVTNYFIKSCNEKIKEIRKKKKKLLTPEELAKEKTERAAVKSSNWKVWSVRECEEEKDEEGKDKEEKDEKEKMMKSDEK